MTQPLHIHVRTLTMAGWLSQFKQVREPSRSVVETPKATAGLDRAKARYASADAKRFG